MIQATPGEQLGNSFPFNTYNNGLERRRKSSLWCMELVNQELVLEELVMRMVEMASSFTKEQDSLF